MKPTTLHPAHTATSTFGNLLSRLLDMAAHPDRDNPAPPVSPAEPDPLTPPEPRQIHCNHHRTFTLVRSVNAPADLVRDLWSAINPLPGYLCGVEATHTRDHSRDVWTLLLLDARTTSDDDTDQHPENSATLDNSAPACHAPLLHGSVAFHDTGTRRCRLVLHLEFDPDPTRTTATTAASPMKDHLSRHISTLKPHLLHFARWFDHGFLSPRTPSPSA